MYSVNYVITLDLSLLCQHNKTTYYAQSNASILCLSLVHSTIQEAWQLAWVSDETVVLWKLSLCMHTPRVEKKLLLSLLSIETSLGSEAEAAVTSKRCHNSRTKRFQRKPHDKNLENTVKNPMTPWFQSTNKVCSRFRGNKQTHTHTHGQNDYRNPTAHAPRVNESCTCTCTISSSPPPIEYVQCTSNINSPLADSLTYMYYM